MKRILSVLCLSLLSVSVAWAILNGTIDTNALYRGVGQIPATAGHPLCTATLISRNAVLTTATCLTDSTPNAVFTFAPDATHAAGLIAIYANPNFDVVGSISEPFDVAVAVLDKSKNRSWRYKQYAVNTNPIGPGTTGSAVGYGQTSSAGAGAGSRNFGSVIFTQYLGDFDAFNNYYGNAYEQINAGTTTYQMICPGDTGGPFLVNGVIAGLAAFAQGQPCGPNAPQSSGFEMTVDRLAPWITATLNQYDPPGACNYNDDTTFATLNGGCEDVVTKLVWGKIDARATQAGAAAECAAETEAGVTGWRLPTGAEYSILASDDPAHHVIRPTDDGSAWTSDVRGSLGGVYNFDEYNVYFGNPTYLHRVLCVRAGS